MAAIITWVQAHLGVLVPLLVAVLDFLFAIAPNLEANGILHWIYLQLQTLVVKK